MAANTVSCITCSNVLPADETVAGFCPRCLYLAARPNAAGTHRGPDVGPADWDQAFPQFERIRILREEGGFVALLGTVLSDECAAGHDLAVLLIWTGESLAEEGEAGALLERIGALHCRNTPEVARIADFGDLAGAVYLLATLPGGVAPWIEEKARPGSDATGGSLESVLPVAGQIAASVRATSGVDLRLDPSLIFLDPSGSPVLVPRPEVTSAAPAGKPLAAQAGTEIGPFTLIDPVGEGGFGEVWKARQERPASRTVALKLLKHGLTSHRLRARFEVEQQALARLDHPHIARFFDGGTTSDGRPYFAMEWIEGLAVNRHCQQQDCLLDERLRLFRQIAEAVHHAHQKGILHRDLKSSNVLVTDVDSEAAAKVIDFGIARAIEEPLTDRTLLTRAEELVGTPASMSPEQAAGAGAAELDARTDVYGLGVLLYELLTGQLPFDPKLPADELRRQIRESDPPRPSSRVSAAHLRKQLRGDLDWITMRCLEKDPERRYRSVSALLRDLERHAEDEPVDAGPPEFSYRIRKFVRRNRAMVAGSLVALVALVVGLLAALDGYRSANARAIEAKEAQQSAESEADKASEVTAFLKKHFFGQLNPTRNSTRGLSLEDAVMVAAEALDREPFNSSEVETEIRLTLAESLEKLAIYPEAERQYRIVFGLLAEGGDGPSPDIMDAHARHARVLSELGRHREACAKQREVVNYWRARSDSDPVPELRSRRDLARYLFADHRLRDGLQIMEQVFEEQRARYGIDHPETLESLSELWYFYYYWEGDFGKAVRLSNELDIQRIYDSSPIEVILAVGRVDSDMSRFDEGDLEVLRARIDRLEKSGGCPPVELAFLRLEHALQLPFGERASSLQGICEELEGIVGATHPSVLRGYWALILALYAEAPNGHQANTSVCDTIGELVEPILDRLEADGLRFAERGQLVARYAWLTGEWGRAIRYYLEFAGQLDASALREAAHVMVFAGDREGFLCIRDTLVNRFGDCDDPYAATVVVEALLDGLLFEPVVEPDTKLVSRLVSVAEREKPDWVKTRICAMRSALLKDDLETAEAIAGELEGTLQTTLLSVDDFWVLLVRAECAARRGDLPTAGIHVRSAGLLWKGVDAWKNRLWYWSDWLPVAAAMDRAERRILGREPATLRVSAEGFGWGRGAENGWLGDLERAYELLHKGAALAHQEDWEEAIELFQESVSLFEGGDGPGYPGGIMARKNIVGCLKRLGRQDEMLEKARELADGLRALRKPEGDRYLAAVLRGAGKKEECVAVLERQITQLELSPDSDPYEVIKSQLQLVEAYDDVGDHAKAKLHTGDIAAKIRLPHLETRKLADAIRCADLGQSEELQQTLFAELGERQLAEIADAGEQAERKDIELFRTAVFLAGNAKAHEKFSRQMLRELSDSRSSITQQRIWTGALCVPTEDLALAEEAVRRLGADLAKNPGHRYWHNFARALASYRAGDHEVALRHIHESPRSRRAYSYSNGTFAMLHLLMEAMIRHRLGDEAQAVELLQEARSEMPQLRSSNRIDRPDVVHWQDGLLCELLFKEAVGLIDGERVRLCGCAKDAEAAAKEGEWSVAVPNSLQALELDRELRMMSPNSLFMHLNILLRAGKGDDFARLFRDLEPRFRDAEDLSAHRAWAWLCCVHPENPDTELLHSAREMADRAVKGAEAESSDYFHGALALGLVELRLGERDEAERWLKLACEAPDELFDCHIPARAYRAIAAHKSKRAEEAAEHLASAEEALEAVEKNPDNWLSLLLAEMALEEARASLGEGGD